VVLGISLLGLLGLTPKRGVRTASGSAAGQAGSIAVLRVAAQEAEGGGGDRVEISPRARQLAVQTAVRTAVVAELRRLGEPRAGAGSEGDAG
jgi:hypothetical protein